MAIARKKVGHRQRLHPGAIRLLLGGGVGRSLCGAMGRERGLGSIMAPEALVAQTPTTYTDRGRTRFHRPTQGPTPNLEMTGSGISPVG
jgi:hypothetical protein